MIIKTAFSSLVNDLSPIYGKQEAWSIARIVFEDAFKITNFSLDKKFEHSTLLETIRQRLLKNEPVQYVLGQADFYGLKFKVTPKVLIPRSETEELVHWILNDISSTSLKIVDIGTGSGCIPITLKKKWPHAEVWAIDKHEEIIDVANQNAIQNAVTVHFEILDILNPEAWNKLPEFDIIISNPPYIPPIEKAIMPAHVLNYEPALALFTPEDDALIFYKKIADLAIQKLRSGGSLFFEVNEFNAEEVFSLLQKKGFKNVALKKDVYQKKRMIKAS